MIIGFTGHRPNKLGNDYDYSGPISKHISDQIEKYLIDISPKGIISGMAIGVDTIASITALYLNIPVEAAIPFEGQESRWPQKSKDLYNKLLTHKLVNITYVCTPGYSPEKMQIRNEYMVNKSDIMIAVWDGTDGGTGNCVKYAKKQKKHIIYIDPKNK